jgi:predicted dehydrogenase
VTNAPFPTVLVGFGRIGASYADDPVMAMTMPYASHAQVLRDHHAFDWVGVVDNALETLEQARNRWGIANAVSDIRHLDLKETIEVAVIATPPEARLGFIEAMPNLKAVVVEKPLGETQKDAEQFLSTCSERNILVQVNLPRRAERDMILLSNGGLDQQFGPVQAAFGVYGNGLSNNGTHLIDLVRQLIGEVKQVQATTLPAIAGPTSLPGDINIGFTLIMEKAISVMVQPLQFSHYREVGLDLWGSRGRLSILHEGYTLIEAEAAPNRQNSTDREIASDTAKIRTSAIGRALYDIYENLAQAMNGSANLLSPGNSALVTMKVIDAIRDSHAQGGCLVGVSS